MPLAWLLMLASAGQAADPQASLEAHFQALNRADTHKWQMFLDEKQQTKAELLERPIFLWTNPTKGKGQHGSVFVWTTNNGQPAVVGSIFVNRTAMGQQLMHEFHTLWPRVIHPRCIDCGGQQWEPKAGITMRPLPGAPKPDASPARRLLQIRAIARDFGGHTFDEYRKLRWELRSQPQPLYRNQQMEGDCIEEALLALVNDAGTDPEVLLLLEARKDGGWHYALMRFADASLYVEYQGKEIWTAVRGEQEQATHNADHTYQFLRMRMIDPSEISSPPAQP